MGVLLFYNSLGRYLLLLYKLVSRWLVSRGRWGIRLGLGVLSFSLVGYVSNISSITVYCISHLLQSAVRKSHIVRARGSVAVSVLGGSVVVVGVVVLDGVRVGVLGGLVRVGGGRSVASGGFVGPGQGGGDEDSQGDEDLHAGLSVF